MAALKACTPLREKATTQSPRLTLRRSPRGRVLTLRGLSRSCRLISSASPVQATTAGWRPAVCGPKVDQPMAEDATVCSEAPSVCTLVLMQPSCLIQDHPRTLAPLKTRTRAPLKKKKKKRPSAKAAAHVIPGFAEHLQGTLFRYPGFQFWSYTSASFHSVPCTKVPWVRP